MKKLDQFWEELFAFIREGRVIPVVGERAVTFGETNQLLYPHLATRLAGRLKLDLRQLPSDPTLTDVACEWLVGATTIQIRPPDAAMSAQLPMLNHAAEARQ